MMRGILLVAVLSVVACKSSKKSEPAATGETAAGAMKTFTLNVTGGDAPVKITADVPSGWSADTSDPDQVTFKVSGAANTDVAFLAIAPGRDPAKRLDKAIEMQFGGTPEAKREDLSDGRVWMSGPLGENTHARIFVPFDGGVVMGVVTQPKESADRLPEIRKVFETIKVVK
jgi:hypothetical protein